MFGFSSSRSKPQSPAPSAVVKDSDLNNFAADVIDASRQTPVFVDFWAPWCGPCKQLTPLLEKVVNEAGGKVKLVKINVDENPEIAQQLRIQSLPTVYVFLDGQPVTGFQGVQPESQLRALIERLTGPTEPTSDGDAQALMEMAKTAYAGGDFERAAAAYAAVLQEDPEQLEAKAGLAKAQIARGRLNEAQQLLDTVPAEQKKGAEIEGALALLTLAQEAGALPAADALAAKVEAQPDDHQSRLDLATSLFLQGQTQPAMDHLLSIIKRDREWQDDGARKHLIRLFEALGPTHPDTVAGRRKLSTVLFS